MLFRSRALNSIFTGRVGHGQGTIAVTTDAMQAFVGSVNENYLDISGYFAPIQSTIVSMTNSIRTDPGSSSELQATERAWGDEVFIRVSWAWLALPTALKVFTVVFLLSVIWQSRKRKFLAWKSSTLVVSRNLSAEMRERLGGLKDNSMMEREAASFDMPLNNEGADWKLRLK